MHTLSHISIISVRQKHVFSFENVCLFCLFFSGQSVIVAPVVDIVGPSFNSSLRSFYLPHISHAVWLSWDGLNSLLSGVVLKQNFSLSQIPAFVRSDRLLPLSTGAESATTSPSINWVFFLDGSQNQNASFQLFEGLC
jgi:alpha-glucosidase (family GH31 glycosyl hydrolase)